MTILVTGGAGYIGSHAVLELLNANYSVVVLDNLSNSSPTALERVAKLAGKAASFIEGDVRDAELLAQVFAKHRFQAVMHFAGLKAVGESVEQPLRYYQNNVNGTMTLCDAMAKAGVFQLVFSSSATVYGEAETMPLTEQSPLGQPSNPYGRTKLISEQFLHDLSAADSRWAIGALRYFNPIGAHSSGDIGEDPLGIPNNLLPYISQVAIGRLPYLSVFGNDYPTPDGTGVRDYIHVVDLVLGHLAALPFLENNKGFHIWNLGTGRGHSVLEIVKAYESVCKKPIPIQIKPRRPGDVATCWSDPSKAHQQLNWQATRTLNDMVRDSWRWQSKNPRGYEGGG